MLRTVQDSIFSKIVRARDKYTCQRCGSKHLPNSSGLHNSHFFSRGKWNTRYDLENCESLCYGCHRYFDGHKDKYREWKIKKLGKRKFIKLQLRSNQIGKKSYFRSKEFTKILKSILVKYSKEEK